MKGEHLLVIEDDDEIAALLQNGLMTAGYRVDVASTGKDGIAQVLSGRYRLIVLDRMLPDTEGTELCHEIRTAGSGIMILMLTAKDTLSDTLDGFTAGADDYITKPFAFEELLARISVLLRRAPAVGLEEITIGDLHIDLMRMSGTRAGRELELTATEFALLRFLAERAGTVQSRLDILKGVWDYDFDPQTNIVEVYIAYLRKKLERNGETKLIHNQRGFGYILSRV